ncbi:hypothetical protein Tco_1259324, partial [Tanacetum coccineum]
MTMERGNKKQKLTRIKEVDELEQRINNVEALFFKLRDKRLKQKEAIIGSNDDTSLHAHVFSDSHSCKETQEEEPKPLDTEEEDPIPLQIVYPHPEIASSSRGTNTRGQAHYALRSLRPIQEDVLKQMAPNPNNIHPSSSFHQVVKTKGFLQLNGTEVYSRAPKHNGKVNSVKSRAIISHSNNEAHVSLKKAHMDMGFTLISLRKETQVSLKRIASLAIRVRSLSDLTTQNVDPMIG